MEDLFEMAEYFSIFFDSITLKYRNNDIIVREDGRTTVFLTEKSQQKPERFAPKTALIELWTKIAMIAIFTNNSISVNTVFFD